jgi:hypothetical protein
MLHIRESSSHSKLHSFDTDNIVNYAPKKLTDRKEPGRVDGTG